MLRHYWLLLLPSLPDAVLRLPDPAPVRGGAVEDISLAALPAAPPPSTTATADWTRGKTWLKGNLTIGGPAETVRFSAENLNWGSSCQVEWIDDLIWPPRAEEGGRGAEKHGGLRTGEVRETQSSARQKEMRDREEASSAGFWVPT